MHAHTYTHTNPSTQSEPAHPQGHTRLATGIHTSSPTPPHHTLTSRPSWVHVHTHPHTHTHRCPQHPAGPEPASPAKRETPAPGEAPVGGTGWQPLSQPQGAAGPGGRYGPVRAEWEEELAAPLQVLRPGHKAATVRPTSPPSPSSSFPCEFLCLDSPGLEGALPQTQSLQSSPGHHLVVHFHYAVGVTATRPVDGDGGREGSHGWGSQLTFIIQRETTEAQRGEDTCPGSHSKSS